MNTLVSEYRQKVPNDPRGDDELTQLFGQQNDIDHRYDGYSDFVQDYRRLTQPAPTPEPDTPPVAAEFRRGVARGAASLGASAVGLGALGADLVGANSLRDSLAAKSRELDENAAAENAPGVSKVEDIHDTESAARWALGKAGELVPNVAEAAVWAGAGALAGSAVEPGGGTVAGGIGGAVEGFLGRQAAKAALRTLLKNGAEIIADKEARDIAIEQLGKIAAREVVPQLSKQTAGILHSEMKALGGTVANSINFAGIGAGSQFPRALQTAETPEDARVAAAIAGLGNALSVAIPAHTIGKLFPGISHDAATGYIKTLGADVIKEIPSAATGMGLMELSNIAADRYADPAKRNLPLTDEELSRILNASVTGGMVGAVMSPVTAARALGKKGGDRTTQPLTAEETAATRTLTPPERALWAAMDPAKPDYGLAPDFIAQHGEGVTPERLAQLAELKAKELGISKGESEPQTPAVEASADTTGTTQAGAEVMPAPASAIPSPEPEMATTPKAGEVDEAAAPTVAKSATTDDAATLQAKRDAAAVSIAPKDNPVIEAAKSKVEQAAAKTDTVPSLAQKQAGNYEKGEVAGADVGVPGVTIKIENPKGSTRTAKDGTWSVTMPDHYGQILGTKGADGDPLDIHIGPNPTAPTVYVVDQVKADGSFDEHKVMLGFESQVQAEHAYDAGFSDGKGPSRRAGGVTAMTKPEFREFLKDEARTKKALKQPPKVDEGFKTRFPVGKQVEYTPPGSLDVGKTEAGKVVGHKVDPTTGHTFAEVELPTGRKEFAGDANNIKPSTAKGSPAAAPAPEKVATPAEKPVAPEPAQAPKEAQPSTTGTVTEVGTVLKTKESAPLPEKPEPAADVARREKMAAVQKERDEIKAQLAAIRAKKAAKGIGPKVGPESAFIINPGDLLHFLDKDELPLYERQAQLIFQQGILKFKDFAAQLVEDLGQDAAKVAAALYESVRSAYEKLTDPKDKSTVAEKQEAHDNLKAMTPQDKMTEEVLKLHDKVYGPNEDVEVYPKERRIVPADVDVEGRGVRDLSARGRDSKLAEEAWEAERQRYKEEAKRPHRKAKASEAASPQVHPDTYVGSLVGFSSGLKNERLRGKVIAEQDVRLRQKEGRARMGEAKEAIKREKELTVQVLDKDGKPTGKTQKVYSNRMVILGKPQAEGESLPFTSTARDKAWRSGKGLPAWQELAKEHKENFINSLPKKEREQIRAVEAEPVEPAFFVPRKQEKGELDTNYREALSKQLLSDSSPPSGDFRNSMTHRMADIRDDQTGEIHRVSVFENNGQAYVTKFDPELGPKNERYKALSLKTVLEAKGKDGGKRYTVVGSVRTTGLSEYYHEVFANRAEYRKAFADEVKSRQEAVRSSAGAEESKMKAAGIEQGAGAKATVDETKAAGEAHEEAPEESRSKSNLAESPEVSQDEASASEGGAAAEHSTDDLPEPKAINLDAHEVETLVKEMPGHGPGDPVDRLLEMLKSPDAISDELYSVITKIAGKDVFFFRRWYEDGARETLAEYDKIDSRKGERVQPSPAEPARNDLQDTGRGSPARAGGPAPSLEGGQDRAGQTKPAEPSQRAEPSPAGNPQPGRTAEGLKYNLPDDRLYEREQREREAKAVRDLDQRLRHTVAEASVRPSKIFSTNASDDAGHADSAQHVSRRAFDAIGKLVGARLIPVEGTGIGPVRFLGGDAFINDRGHHTPFAQAGRAMAYLLRNSNPEAFAELKDSLSRMRGVPVSDELVARAVADNLLTPGFWRDRAVGALTEAGSAWKALIQKLDDAGVREDASFRTRGFFKDPAAVQEAVAKALDRAATERPLERAPETQLERTENPANRQLHGEVMDALRQAGIVVTERVGDKVFGEARTDTGRLLRGVRSVLTRQDVITDFHEAAHFAFAGETPEVQERLLRGISRLSDEAIGVDMSPDVRIRADDPTGMGAAAVHEERLVESTARKMADEGFSPEAAKGYAQRFVRALKDFYFRAVMKVQEMIGHDANPDLARRYFENKVQSLLAGDTIGQSYIDFIGARKPSLAHRVAHWFGGSERLDHNGMPVADGASNLTLAGGRFNLDAAMADPRKFNLPEQKEERGRTLAAVKAELRAASINHLDATVKRMAESLRENPELVRAMGKKSPEEFLRSLVPMADTKDLKAQISGAKEPNGSNVVFDENATENNFKGQANRGEVIAQQRKNAEGLSSALSKAEVKATESIDSESKRVERKQKKLTEAAANYKDLQGQTTQAVHEMAANLKEFYSAIRASVRGLVRRKGLIEQQLALIDPKAEIKDYAKAAEHLAASGMDKVANVLDDLANDPKVDFSQPIDKIRDALLLQHVEGGKYESLLHDTKESRLMLATAAAFAKTHQREMAELELRRVRDAGERVKIEAKLEGLDKSKDAGKQLKALARTATLEERLRIAHVQARRDLRKVTSRIAKDKQRLEAIRMARPVVEKELTRLGAAQKIGVEATFGHEMPYNVPDKPTSSDADIMARTKTGEIGTVNKVMLDSRGKITNPLELEGHVRKMTAWLNEREARARAGDEDALSSVYQGIRRQRDEIAEHLVYTDKLTEPHRFGVTLALMPVGDRLAEAFGTTLSRLPRIMLNRYQQAMENMKPFIERLGNPTNKLERDLLRMLPNRSLDSLREDIIDDVKNLQQHQHDLEEIHADQPAKLRAAIYERVRQRLMDTQPQVRPVIDQFMPKLKELLEHEERAKDYLEKQNRTGAGIPGMQGLDVLDPKLKALNPATGEYETAVRAARPVGAYTWPQRIGKTMRIMANALNGSGWAGLGDLLKPGEGEGVPSEFLKAYQADPAKARAMVEKLANHDEYKDAVRNQFVRALMTQDTESNFNGPELADAVTKPPADTAKMKDAYEASGFEKSGDLVGLAERIFDEHEGTGDKGQFVEDTLRRFNEIYREVNNIVSKNEGEDHIPSQPEIRGMTPDHLINARTIEHLPGTWFSRHSYDQRNMFKQMQRIASQIAFGRGQERLAGVMDSLAAEVDSAKKKLATADLAVRDANGGAILKGKEYDRQMAERLPNYELLKKQAENSKLLKQSIHGLSDFFRKDNSPDGTLNWVARAAHSIGALLVNQPSSAINTLEQLYAIQLKYGHSTSALGATVHTLGQFGKEAAASLAQAIGMQLQIGGEDFRLYRDLGYNDPTTVRDYMADFTRQEGESRATQFFRGAQNMMGFGINRVGAAGERTVFRPMQPFHWVATMSDFATTAGVWQLARRLSAKGVEFYQANRGQLEDPTFKLDSTKLKLRGAEKDTFDRFTRDMEGQGLNYDDMVRGAIQRGDKTLFSNDEARALYGLGVSKVLAESNITTMPPASYNNSVLRVITPLLGWSFRRSQQLGELGLNAEGRREMVALAHGMAGLGIMAAGGLGVSAAVNAYSQNLLGKKRNLRDIVGPDARETALGIFENLNRVGTLGLLGELANGVVNVGTGADNRIIDVDKRVVALSAFYNIQQAISSYINQGEADYTHVVRPLVGSMGGAGLIQYMQLANRALGLDNPESRMTARTNAQNWLRAVGRELQMDVRETGGGGGYSNVTPMSPHLTRMELAAYGNNPSAFMEAYQAAIEQAKESGNPDPVDYVKRAYSTRNPLRQVFRTPPTEAEYKRLLAALPSGGSDDVSQAVDLFNSFAERIGARGFEGKVEKADKPLKIGLPKFNANPTAMRNAAAASLYR